MADDKIPTNDSLATLLGKALAEHGDDAVLAAWLHFTVPFLPVAAAIAQFQGIMDSALAHKLKPDDVLEAIALLGALRSSDNPHYAWMAAEIITRSAKNTELCIAALRGQPKQPEKPN